MTPSDLNEYLKVLTRNHAGAAVLELPGGVKVSVTFMPELPPNLGTDPTPGGWKSPQHLDNLDALRPDGDYTGELPQ